MRYELRDDGIDTLHTCAEGPTRGNTANETVKFYLTNRYIYVSLRLIRAMRGEKRTPACEIEDCRDDSTVDGIRRRQRWKDAAMWNAIGALL